GRVAFDVKPENAVTDVVAVDGVHHDRRAPAGAGEGNVVVGRVRVDRHPGEEGIKRDGGNAVAAHRAVLDGVVVRRPARCGVVDVDRAVPVDRHGALDAVQGGADQWGGAADVGDVAQGGVDGDRGAGERARDLDDVAAAAGVDGDGGDDGGHVRTVEGGVHAI